MIFSGTCSSGSSPMMHKSVRSGFRSGFGTGTCSESGRTFSLPRSACHVQLATFSLPRSACHVQLSLRRRLPVTRCNRRALHDRSIQSDSTAFTVRLNRVHSPTQPRSQSDSTAFTVRLGILTVGLSVTGHLGIDLQAPVVDSTRHILNAGEASSTKSLCDLHAASAMVTMNNDA